MKMRHLLIVLAGFAAGGAVYADPIEPDTIYELGNHPNGAETEPFYGLRLDGLLSGNGNHIYTFDFEAPGSAMTMFWDGSDDSLTISGTAYGGKDTGDTYGGTGNDAPRIWTINFVYNVLDSSCPDGTGLCAHEGKGSIKSDVGEFNLFDESGNHGFAFQLDFGHRTTNDTLVGWGWLNHCPADTSSCGGHIYSSDWLFTATKKVPEPGTLALLGLGLAGAGFARRKRPA